MYIDARLPVRFGLMDSRAPGEALLLDCDIAAEEPLARFTTGPTQHAIDCACCVPRSGAATALAMLFRARAIGQGPPFRGVLAVVDHDGEAAVRAALEQDPMVAGRYRLAAQ